jgi:hypothetical protein
MLLALPIAPYLSCSLGEEYNLWSSSLYSFLQLPITSSLFGPNMLLTACSQILPPSLSSEIHFGIILSSTCRSARSWRKPSLRFAWSCLPISLLVLQVALSNKFCCNRPTLSSQSELYMPPRLHYQATSDDINHEFRS